MKGVFPVDFEAPSSSRFRTITSQKNAAEVAKQSRSNIMWLFFLGIVLTLLCSTSTFGGGQFFCLGGGRKRCSRSQQLLFLKFSAAKYVTQTPFFDTMYMMKSFRATSFPALAARADSKHLVDTHPNQSAIPVVWWAKGAWMNHSFVQLNFQQESVGSWWLKRWLIFGLTSITSTFGCATIIQ